MIVAKHDRSKGNHAIRKSVVRNGDDGLGDYELR